MSLLVREIVGWLLAVVGLVLIGFVLILALRRDVLEALALSLPASVVFRAGIGLVRLATAARLAAQIDAEPSPRRDSERAKAS
jgi:hypothetical protein